jgi:hypothetical protein
MQVFLNADETEVWSILMQISMKIRHDNTCGISTYPV